MFKRRRWGIWMIFALAFILIAALPVAFAFPTNNQPFLSIKGIGNSTESDLYYAALDSAFGPTATFSQWKAKYGFSGSNDVRAIYYNAGDLGFGREMHCRKSGLDVACYVANHGLGASTPPEAAVNDAIANQNTLPTVAMVYKNALAGQPNDVSFYIYAPDGTRLNSVALDGEGEKFTPQLCLPCHGGIYDKPTHSASDAHFLPFDVASFRYSAQPGFRLSDQQEAFRQLNAMVREANPAPLIAELVDGWYGGNVNVPGTQFNANFVAPGFAGDPGLYNNVIKPDCRMCHIAQTFALSTTTDVAAAQYAVFAGFYMPHSQLTSQNFWNSPAPTYLANDQGWAFRVTKTDDTNDGVCDADCSLREAILAANASASPSVITFDVNGTFQLTLSGEDDVAAVGDLDITKPVVILGNGTGSTIMDGGNIDRMFQIFPSADVVIQNVTIQNGNTIGVGGGVDNAGGKLTLNSTIVRNNTAPDGSGIYNQLGGATEINNSAIGPNNPTTDFGGGIYNDGFGANPSAVTQVTLNNSTVSGNTASRGAGIYSDAGVVNITQSTITGNNATDLGGGIRAIGGAIVKIQNSLVAGNSGVNGEADCRVSSGGFYISLGHNLVGQNGSVNGCPTVSTDVILTGAIETVLNTNLTGEQGGPSYHALIPGSPAIDAVSLGAGCALPSYDERNLARPLDGNLDGVAACDMGAREFNQVSVNSRLDIVADDGLCTLREAVTAANTGLPSGILGGECPGSPDVIHLAVAGPYDLTQGQLTILGAVTINGNGQIIRRTSGASRIFEVKSGGDLNLSNVTIRDGAQGGPYYLDTSSGGGLFVNGGGVANIVNSAILNNHSASWGGGIANLGTLNIANSTVSGNSAAVDSGGINNRGTANLINVTVSENTADTDADEIGDGGGVGGFGGTTTIKNSLVAGNFDTPGNTGASIPLNAEAAAAVAQAGQGRPTAQDVDGQATINPDVYALGTVISADYNLIGNDTGSNGAFSGAHDQVGTSGNLLDPKLDALTGSPAYYPLLPGSPAIDRIPAASCAFISNLGNPLFRANSPVSTDQRGVSRPVNLTCDIGSVESQNVVFLPLILR